MNESLEFAHTVLSELIMRRWKEERPYYTAHVIGGLCSRI